MGITSEVKCSRCDKRYSGLRSRCPYCGTRRSSHGKRANTTDNSKIKVIIGVLLLLIVIVAVIIMLASSQGEGPDGTQTIPSDNGSAPPVTEDTSGTPPDSDATETPPDDVSETPPPTDNVAIESVRITYLGSPIADFTMNVAENLQLDCQVVPADTALEPLWQSSDEGVFKVLENGSVTAMGSGTATLKVTVGGVSAECIVRVE
jgi:DNA-directed RNA polymerase subunit RPC12/RpoP